MKIWDTAGQERFKSMSVQVIKTSDAVILVYAINDRNSFNALDKWLLKIIKISQSFIYMKYENSVSLLTTGFFFFILFINLNSSIHLFFSSYFPFKVLI